MSTHSTPSALAVCCLLVASPSAPTLGSAQAAAPPRVSLPQTPPRPQAPQPLARAEQASDLVERALERTIERLQSRIEAARVDLFVDHSSWENPWLVGTPHYRVRTLRSYSLGRDVGRALEWMLPHFQAMLGSAYAPGPQQQVYVFPTLSAYNKFGNDNSGLESSILGGHYAAAHAERPIVVYDCGNLVQIEMWATHASFLQFEADAFPREVPTWVSRGLASYFSLFWDFDYGVTQLARLRDEKRALPLARLLSESLDRYSKDPDAHFIELGMLFSYLLNFREDTRDQVIDGRTVPGPFCEYLRAHYAHRSLLGNAVQELLTSGVAQLEADFLEADFGR